jgi:predicted nucleic acid-binding protein
VISFDTNILIYAFDFDAGRKQVRANNLVNAVAGNTNATIALQVLTEFHAVSRRKGMSIQDALGFVGHMRGFCDVVALDERAFDAGIQAMTEHRLHIWDAMLWAALDQAGCRTLFTEDFQDGRTLGGVMFLNPFNPANDETIARLTRPLR